MRHDAVLLVRIEGAGWIARVRREETSWAPACAGVTDVWGVVGCSRIAKHRRRPGEGRGPQRCGMARRCW